MDVNSVACRGGLGMPSVPPRKHDTNDKANAVGTVRHCCPLQGFWARREGGAGAGWVRGRRPEPRTGKRTQFGLNNVQPTRAKVTLPL